MWPQKRRLKSEFSFFQSLLQLLQPFTLSNEKIFLTFQCLSWALQLTLFTINHNEFTGMEKEEISSWSWGFVLLSMLRTVCKHAFWGRLLTIIVSSDFPLKLEWVLFFKWNLQCGMSWTMCSFKCKFTLFFSVFKSDWVNIYLRCNKINFEIILKSQYGRKKSHWYYVILSQQEII